VFVALGAQHEMRMRHISIRALLRSTIFFHVISQTARFSEKKVTEHEMGVFIFYTTFVCNIFILGRTERDMKKNVYWSSCKVLVILVRFK
jgi:hypothetical protein